MGVADFMLGETALAILRDQVLAREAVVDLARCSSFDARNGASSETHSKRG
jgi:hypothetical protein